MQIRNRIRKSFAIQLMVFISSFLVVIFGLMYFVNQLTSKDIITENAEQLAKSLTWEVINQINGILYKIEEQTRNSAYLIGELSLGHKEQEQFFIQQVQSDVETFAICVAFTPEYLANHPGVTSHLFYASDSLIVHKEINNQANEYQLEDWFIIPYAKKKTYWSEPWVDRNSGTEPITSFSVPIEKDGKVIGIVRTDISLKVLQRIVTSVRVSKTGYAVMITNNGTFVTHPADSLILNYTIFSYAEELNNRKLKQVGKEMVSGKKGFVHLPYSEHYSSRWIYYAPITLNKWAIGVKFDDKEIMGDLRKIYFYFSLILGLGFLVLLFAIYTRIATIFKPLRILSEAANKIGSGDFEVNIPHTKAINEVSLLTDAFSKMQIELKSYTENLIKTNREKDKITSEIKFAALIQQSIVPSNQNLIPEVKEVSIFGFLDAAEEIGGDLYDAFLVDKDRLCFTIADVFGKGIVASMMMTMVQTLIRSKAKHTNSATTLIREINTYLCENNKHQNFITIIIGFIDLKTGVVEFCNSGHTPMYLRKANQECIRYGETHTTALGIFPDLEINSSFIQLDIDDILIMFTDGITEAMSENEAFFGYQRLESIICQMQNPNPESIVKSILKGISVFTGKDKQNDDLSILVIKFNRPHVS
jgi:sigma-B regulation protein RsbU (phosphoserine phosphatase)